MAQLREALAPYARRIRMQHTVASLTTGLAAALGVIALLLLGQRLTAQSVPAWALFLTAGCVGSLLAILGLVQPLSLHAVARQVDRQGHMNQKLVTALECAEAEPNNVFLDVLLDDATASLGKTNVYAILPWSLGKEASLLGGALLGLSVVLLLAPPSMQPAGPLGRATSLGVKEDIDHRVHELTLDFLRRDETERSSGWRSQNVDPPHRTTSSESVPHGTEASESRDLQGYSQLEASLRQRLQPDQVPRSEEGIVQERAAWHLQPFGSDEAEEGDPSLPSAARAFGLAIEGESSPSSSPTSPQGEVGDGQDPPGEDHGSGQLRAGSEGDSFPLLSPEEAYAYQEGPFLLTKVPVVVAHDDVIASFLEELFPPDEGGDASLEPRQLSYREGLFAQGVSERVPTAYRDLIRQYFMLLATELREGR